MYVQNNQKTVNHRPSNRTQVEVGILVADQTDHSLSSRDENVPLVLPISSINRNVWESE